MIALKGYAYHDNGRNTCFFYQIKIIRLRKNTKYSQIILSLIVPKLHNIAILIKLTWPFFPVYIFKKISFLFAEYKKCTVLRNNSLKSWYLWLLSSCILDVGVKPVFYSSSSYIFIVLLWIYILDINVKNLYVLSQCENHRCCKQAFYGMSYAKFGNMSWLQRQDTIKTNTNSFARSLIEGFLFKRMTQKNVIQSIFKRKRT